MSYFEGEEFVGLVEEEEEVRVVLMTPAHHLLRDGHRTAVQHDILGLSQRLAKFLVLLEHGGPVLLLLLLLEQQTLNVLFERIILGLDVLERHSQLFCAVALLNGCHGLAGLGLRL